MTRKSVYWFTARRSKFTGNNRLQNPSLQGQTYLEIWTWIWSISAKVKCKKKKEKNGKFPIWNFEINSKRVMVREKRRRKGNNKNTHGWRGNYKLRQCLSKWSKNHINPSAKNCHSTSLEDLAESIRLIYTLFANNTHKHTEYWSILAIVGKCTEIDRLNICN